MFDLTNFNETIKAIRKKTHQSCEEIAQISKEIRTAAAAAPTINMQAFDAAIKNIQQHN